MIPKAIDEISKSDIDSIVSKGVAESRTLEFKRELPVGSDPGKKEFLADVSSFANTTGGDIRFGVDELDGVTNAAEGVHVANVDAELLRTC